MFRIPGKISEISSPVSKPAVLLQHGLMCDSMFYLANDPEKTPAFILVEQGYDVWLGNNRGNRFARGHTSFDTSEQAFWDFNFMDMGKYDTPAFIDFVLSKTKQSKLTYIGHIQGTAQAFVGASLNPEFWAERLNLFVALAPVASTHNLNVASAQKASKYWREIQFAA